MNRPPIPRHGSRPLYSIVSHDPDKRGGFRTCTVRNTHTGSIVHGPDTDYRSCVRACHRLSMGEDIFPFDVVQRSVEFMQARLVEA